MLALATTTETPPLSSDAAGVTVSENQLPRAGADVLAVRAGLAATVDVLANDSDPDGDALSVVTATDGAHGSVNCTPAGACTYTSTPGYAGPDTFAYTVEDGYGGSDTATVTVTVNENQPPRAQDDTLAVRAGLAATLDVLANDSDPDGDTLSLAAASDGAHGSVECTPAGSCTYTSAPDYAGPDAFTYTVEDGYGGADTGTVTVTLSQNEPPQIGRAHV